MSSNHVPRVKERLLYFLDVAGLGVLAPVVRLVTGENSAAQIRPIVLYIGVPVLSFSVFLAAWSGIARSVETSFATLPTPGEVFAAGRELIADHFASRQAAKDFEAAQVTRAARFEGEAAALRARAASEPDAGAGAELTERAELFASRAASAREARYAGSPTYLDQIFTSLRTVFAGFLIASLIAVPIGILCGLSPVVRAALEPLIQIFKPVSPLAWLPIVMIVVGALYTTDPREAWFARSFISSAVTVALCSLWPTLVNTALGVASIEKDHLNVARVLRLPWWTKLRKIVIPSALPLIFTGLRISLGVGWMVLIAAEMLAQNPGLGKFVWDMFQNGSSQTLARILVAVFTIGVIGFGLDRIMLVIQRALCHTRTAA